MRIIEGRDTCTYRVLIKNRILLFRNNYAWGYVPELKSIGFEDKGGYYKRPCDPSEIEAAYCLEGDLTNYKGYEVMVINSFEPLEYMNDDVYGGFIVNKFFEQANQTVFRLEFIFDYSTKVDSYSKYSYDKQRKNRMSIFEYNMQRILRLEFGPNYNERIDLKIADKDTHQWGEFYLLDVLDDDIPDVWQIRKPVEGFPMLGEEKVYIKKDGVWLPRNEYGSRIDE